MASPSPSANKRATEVKANIDEKIERLEEQIMGLTEEIKRLEEDLERQESQSAASSGVRKVSKMWLSYEIGKAGEDMARRRSMIEKKKAAVEGNQQWIAEGRKWQRGIEVAGALAELDNRMREYLARIDWERDQLEQLQREAEQLHNEQREMAIETGGTAWILLFDELQGAERALREWESTKTMMEKEEMVERQRRRTGDWSECESD
jgi:uncharacterized small protein (DUF1192 family)